MMGWVWLMKRFRIALAAACLFGSCSKSAEPRPDAGQLTADAAPEPLPFNARPNVFIPPYRECRAPLPGATGRGPDGKVCTNVGISGCTEPDKKFGDYGSCAVVKTQRPYHRAPPHATTNPADPRLANPTFMTELQWVSGQVQACACVCCHSASLFGSPAAQWDTDMPGIWTDSISDTGVALFAGRADSSVLGAYPPIENHGFDRQVTGIPTTDSGRMQAFFDAELKRRGLSPEEVGKIPPFGGPIYDNLFSKPTICSQSEGVDAQGKVRWMSGSVRYVYILTKEAKNPGVPPNLDRPEGTLWRLNVPPSQPGILGPVDYGKVPPGAVQAFPETSAPAPLVDGETYHLFTFIDVGLPGSHCLFTYRI